MKYVKSIRVLAIFIVIPFYFLSAQNSVLSTGNWYKLSTTENGIYKIGYTDLQSFGIDPSTINPKTIRIFGNGNGMLPEDPDAFRYNDLKENAIFVYGENDLSFDLGDYILFYGESPIVWKLTEFNQKVVYFEHEKNLYTDKVCYFLNVGSDEGKRIGMQYSTLIPPTYTSSSFNEYLTHDEDSINVLRSGKLWCGETFNDVVT